jgi:predicted nucleotidyltransferase
MTLMFREKVIRRLQQHQADLKRLGVEHLYLFGSTARGEAREDSDVDLLSGLRAEEQVHNRQGAADLTMGARSRP